MNGRIKYVRTEADLTQSEFAQELGVSKSAIYQIEAGINKPSEQTLRAICTIYHVNRQWLEYGIEPMRAPEDEDDEIVDAVLAGENDFIKAVIRGIARTPDGWEHMRKVFTAIQEELDKIEKTDS